jgi:hypothetical protein
MYRDTRFFRAFSDFAVTCPGKVEKIEEAARLIVGQAKMACDLVQAGTYLKAFSIGGGMHHAKRRSGEGFWGFLGFLHDHITPLPLLALLYPC